MRSKKEIKEILARAERAADNAQKEVDHAHILLREEKHIVLKRLGINHGVIHALSWVLNEEGIGQIAPA